MKTIFALLLCFAAATADAQNARPLPPETAPGIVPGEPAPEESPIIEEFFGPGRYQLVTAQITIEGKERSVVLRLDTATGKVWMLEAMPNFIPGKPALRFVEVQDNLPRPRLGFPGGAPGGVGIEAAPVPPPFPPGRTPTNR